MPSEDSYSGSFTVLPLRVPKASQTVSVEIRVKYDDRSGKVADSVIKEILVEVRKLFGQHMAVFVELVPRNLTLTLLRYLNLFRDSF